MTQPENGGANLARSSFLVPPEPLCHPETHKVELNTDRKGRTVMSTTGVYEEEEDFTVVKSALKPPWQ